MNTSVQEHRAPQQQMHHGVEGNTKPHTGPKAFAAMKQNEARKQSTTTPQALRQGQPGRRMKQPDTQREGPAQKLDQDAAGEQPMGGREATTSRGGGATAQHNKTSNKQTKQKGGGSSPTTQEAAHKGQREDNRKNAGRKTHRPKTTQRSHSKKGKQGEDNKQTEGKESTAKNNQNRGPGGGQDHEQASKRSPTRQQQVGAGN